MDGAIWSQPGLAVEVRRLQMGCKRLPALQRREGGLIPGTIMLPRNSLEWRCDPASPWRQPAITRWDHRIILICDQGYQSSLAAATPQRLGLAHTTDLDGGFTAWAAAGLPVITPDLAEQHRR